MFITVTDPAGNATTLELPFTLDVKAPPLCFEKVAGPPTMPTDLASHGLDDLTLHAPFAVGAPNSRVGQLRVRNPFPVPLRFKPAAALSVTTLGKTSRAAFRQNSSFACVGSSCAIGQCQACNYAPAGTCGAWSDLQKSGVVNTLGAAPGSYVVHTDVTKDTPGAVGPSPDAAGYYPVPGEASRYLNVIAILGSTCALHPPETFSHWSGGTNTPRTVFVVADGQCALPTTTGDHRTRCRSSGNKNSYFHTPRYYTAVSVSAPGAAGDWGVSGLDTTSPTGALPTVSYGSALSSSIPDDPF